jgi:putative ATPase
MGKKDYNDYDELSLFQNKTSPPLAERMRPNALEGYLGQYNIIGEGKPLRKAIENDSLMSIVLWGPPGCGKTTLARIIREKTKSHFVHFNAVTSGVADIKRVMREAKDRQRLENRRTILFVDEIHRFNKAQQDAFLPAVEDGTIILIGATTENPSFELISPLLSRSKVFVLEPLSKENLMAVLKKALQDKDKGLGKYNVEISDVVLELIIELSYNDARISLNTLEFAVTTKRHKDDEDNEAIHIDRQWILDVVQKSNLHYDKGGEEHFNLISAVHKCLRDSDPNASVYWITRMLEGGEDPLYIARRLVRFATEDIGLADPNALRITISAKETCEFLGMPECALALIEAGIYLAMSPKSNSIYMAYKKAREDIRKYGHLPVPKVIRNAPTKLMKDLGYSKGYKYAHEYDNAEVEQEHLPEQLKGSKYYIPTDRGIEKKLKEKLSKRKNDKIK